MQIGVIVLAVILLVISLVLYEPKKEEDIFSGQENSLPQQVSTYIYVDIKGEVMHPGVYKVQEGSRVFQLVSLAGGYKENANTNGLNLSRILKDQQVIYIPNTTEVVIDIVDNLPKENETIKININNAPVALLETLPGIGPSTAKAITDYIEMNSYFDSIEDIKNVPGIGVSTFEAIKDLITTD